MSVVHEAAPAARFDPARRVFAEGLGGRPVTRILVTHFHPDHLGLGTWLAARWDAEVWMTQGEWMTARGVHAETGEAEIANKIAFYRRNGFAFDGAEQTDPGTPGVVEARMVR